MQLSVLISTFIECKYAVLNEDMKSKAKMQAPYLEVLMLKWMRIGLLRWKFIKILVNSVGYEEYWELNIYVVYPLILGEKGSNGGLWSQIG